MSMMRISVAAFAAAALLSTPAWAEGLKNVGFADSAGACQAVGDLSMTAGGQRRQMQYAVPQISTRARGMGFGGVAVYAVLPGGSSSTHITDKSPSFELIAPANMQVQGMFTLARLESRRNNTRAVAIGQGYMSYSTGVVAERQVPVTSTPVSGHGPAGTTVYRITPESPLDPGEYAMIISTDPQTAAGQGTGKFYDFAVD
jgi:hypothetical protein